MRTLSAELLAAQKAQGVVPYVKAVITDGGENTYTFDNLGIGGIDRRLRGIPEQIEEPFGGGAVIYLKNSDQYFASKNLKGYAVTLGFGAKINGSYEVSNVAPLFVRCQRDISYEGELVTELYCNDLWWYAAYKLVVLAGQRLNGTISGEFEYGETVTSSPGGYTGRVSQISPASIIITSYSDSFNGQTSAIGGSSGASIAISSVDTVTRAGGLDYGKGKSTILEILQAIVPDKIADVVVDSDAPDGSNKVAEYKPCMVTDMGYARNFIRQLLQKTPCVGRLENDSKLHILYPDSEAEADYTYQTDHVFWYQLRERAVILPNTAVFVNHMPGDLPDGIEQYKGSASDADSLALLGEELIHVDVDPSIESDEEAQVFAEAWISQRVNEVYKGAVRAPMHCGQELYDQVSVIDARSGVTITGRVGRIVRRWLPPINSEEHAYDIEVTLGGLQKEPGEIGGPGTLDMDLADLGTTSLPVKTVSPIGGWQVPPGHQAYIADVDFTSEAYNKISWTSGNVKLGDGRIQTIDAGNLTFTGTRYLYVVWGNSTLQSSATYSDAIGEDRMLVGVASSGSSSAVSAYVLNPHTDSILINRDKVMDNLVNDLKLASEAVTEAKIAANAVTSGKIAALAVIAGKLAANSVVAANIQASAVTSDKINAGAVTAIKIDAGAIDATKLAAEIILSTIIWAGSNKVKLSSSGIAIYGQNMKFYTSAGTYIADIYCPDEFTLSFLTQSARDIKILPGSLVTYTHSIRPTTNGRYLGQAGDYKWYYVYRANESACELPTTNSALDVIRKIPKPKIKDGEYGTRHYFEDDGMPSEIKFRPEKDKLPPGVKYKDTKEEIEFTRLMGVLTQAVVELTEKVDTLEARLT